MHARFSITVVWLLAVMALIMLTVATAGIPFDPLSPLATAGCLGLMLGIGSGVGLLVWRWRHRPAAPAHLIVAATAVITAGTLLVALAKTPFGVQGLAADQSFRTAIMQRFSMTWLPLDFGYEGRGTFYPPLWFWLSGRFADLVGMPGWEMMKWAQIATAFAVPVIGYLCWRRVTTAPAAAVVVAVTVLGVPDVIKGDEWLSLTIMLPWWLDAFADVRRETARRRPAWLHGVVAGLMLSLYTAFFVPAAVATVILVILRWRRDGWAVVRSLLRRWVVLVAAGLVVWAWVWVPTLQAALTGPPSDNIQFRWFGDVNAVPRPVTLTVVGLLVLAGLLALAWFAPRDRLFGAIAVFTAAIAVVMVVGLLATAADHPILVQKTYLVLRHTLIAAAVLAAFTGWARVRDHAALTAPGRADAAGRVLAVLGTALVVTLGMGYVDDAVRTDRLTAAYDERLPDGSVSRYAPDPASARASADEVAQVIEQRVDTGGEVPVVLSVRYDLFVFQGYWNFQQFTGSYAHPHSEWQQRSELLEEMAKATDSAALHRLVTANRFQRIDALVLEPADSGYAISYRQNVFPYGTKVRRLVIAERAVADPSRFDVVELDASVIIIPR